MKVRELQAKSSQQDAWAQEERERTKAALSEVAEQKAEQNKLRGTYDRLKEERRNLQKNYADLQAQMDDLQRRYDALLVENTWAREDAQNARASAQSAQSEYRGAILRGKQELYTIDAVTSIPQQPLRTTEEVQRQV